MTRHGSARVVIARLEKRRPRLADHFAIFPTLLELMGYDARWVEGEYGDSLFTADPARPGAFSSAPSTSGRPPGSMPMRRLPGEGGPARQGRRATTSICPANGRQGRRR